jgi:membrane-associated phospholipid phosphatase
MISFLKTIINLQQTYSMLNDILQKQKYFLIPLLSVLLLGSCLVVIWDKGDLHLLTNTYNTPFLDLCMPYLTHIGDGMFAAICIAALLFVKLRHALQLGLSVILSALITQFAKNYFGLHRPIEFFGDSASLLHIVEGVELHRFNSFPSGHATTAFALFFTLSLLFGKQYRAFLFFIMAFIAAFSRVYLSQHFLQDVLMGACIGTLSSLFVYVWFAKSKLFNSEKLNRKIVN